MLEARDLPNDIEALKRLILDQRAQLTDRDHEIERLKLLIARLKRLQFGRSSEKLDRQIGQLELVLEDLETNRAARTIRQESPAASSAPKMKPVRRPLPAHLPREHVVHEIACTCSDCGVPMRRIGEDVAEVLEYVPASFKVVRHVRPKFACARCERIVQAPAPTRPIARGIAGPGLLAHVLVSKYADHLPLYRQSQIYERQGVELERSTLADCVGGAAALLEPLVEALARYTLDSQYLHGDDTPVPVLEPGRGSTKTGRLWTYVRDGRPWAEGAPPAVFFRYSPDRKGERAESHLKNFAGVLHADAYAGFDRLYEAGRITEAACWGHVRRKFFDIHESNGSPLGAEALARIRALYEIEAAIRGQSPDERRAIRQARAGPMIVELKAWLEANLAKVSVKSALAVAIRYALSRWSALGRYCEDGHIEIDNNAAERALRAVALGRKNYLFAGSDAGGERAAAIYSLIGTAKLNGLDPEAYLREVLERIRASDQSDRGAAAMESRRRKTKPGSTRRISAKIVASEALDSSVAQSLVLPNLEIFLQGDGAQFSIGAIGPIQCAAVAGDDYNMQAALVRRQGETLHQLLARLDAAVGLAMEQDVFTDEINPPPRG